MSDQVLADSSRFQKLFLREELRGDRLINTIRFFILFALLALALLKADVVNGLQMSKSLTLTLVLIGIGYSYTITLFLLYRAGIYYPLFKYFSVSIDITLVVLSIYSYRLDPYPVYAQIFLLARISLIYWFILWSLVRYNIWLSLYSGLLAAAEYFLLIVLNNDLNGVAFSFVAPDGMSYTSIFTTTESLLRVVYIALAGVMAAFVAQRLRSLVTNSISQEEAKNELETKNQLVETVNRENRKYLDGITQGLLLVNDSFAISEQYSRSLTKVFPRREIAGANLVDFLFPDSATQEVDRRDLAKYLRILFTSTTVDADTLREVNPLSERIFRIADRDGQISERVLAVSFQRLLEKGVVTNVMVVFEDRTEVAAAQRDLQEERHRHGEELETVSVILKTGPKALREFIEDSRALLMEAQAAVARLEDREVVHRTFRKLHGLKGSAASLGFTFIASLTHTAEELLSQIRDDSLRITSEVRKEIEERIKDIFTSFDTIQRLTKSFSEFSQMAQPSAAENSLTQLEEFFSSLRAMTADLGKQLEKNATLIVHNTLHEIPFLPTLKNALIHLVRNAVDHGLEDVYERLSKGKAETGTLTLRTFMKDRSYVLELSDDGRGLDFEVIAKKAFERGLLPPGDAVVPQSKLLEVLFAPGFTTREEATTVSGRGVGLDLVRDTVRELRGRISVSTAKDGEPGSPSPCPRGRMRCFSFLRAAGSIRWLHAGACSRWAPCRTSSVRP